MVDITLFHTWLAQTGNQGWMIDITEFHAVLAQLRNHSLNDWCPLMKYVNKVSLPIKEFDCRC